MLSSTEPAGALGPRASAGQSQAHGLPRAPQATGLDPQAPCAALPASSTLTSCALFTSGEPLVLRGIYYTSSRDYLLTSLLTTTSRGQ